MKLNVDLENTYKQILDYSGLGIDQAGAIVVLGGDDYLTTDDGRVLHLPYNCHLNNPTGKQIFHPLNENYLQPESESFILYKETLTAEVNLKLALLMDLLINLSCNIPLQKKIKNKDLRSLIVAIAGPRDGEKSDFEPVMGETLIRKVLAKAANERGPGSFIDFFFKRDGEVDGEKFGVVGKTNFILHKEIETALMNKDYKLYGQVLRKRDIIVYKNLIDVIFPDMDNIDAYAHGVDNDQFGFLHALLGTTYILTCRINEILELLKIDLGSSLDSIDELSFNMGWVGCVADIINKIDVIRSIPNQDDIIATSKNKTNKLSIDTSNIPQHQPNQTVHQQHQPQHQQPQVTQTPIHGTHPNNFPNQQNIHPHANPNQAPIHTYQQPQQPNVGNGSQLTIEEKLARGIPLNNYQQYQQQQYPPQQQYPNQYGYQQPQINPYTNPTWLNEMAYQQQYPQQQQQFGYQQQPNMYNQFNNMPGYNMGYGYPNQYGMNGNPANPYGYR